MEINFKREFSGSVEDVVKKLTAALAKEGFGILTRIDFDRKIKEKLGQDMKQVVILGACNPSLAYEAYLKNSDVASLIPCNAVVREVAEGRVSVEIAKPSVLMKMLGDNKLVEHSADADKQLQTTLEQL